MNQPLQFTLDPKRTAWTLSWIAFGLLVLHMVAAYLWTNDGADVVHYGYVDMFDLDEEAAFGTWFAAVILLIAGRLLLLVSRDSRASEDGLWVWWFVLALGFHWLSIDEVAGMHEFLNTYGEKLLGLDSRWTTYAFIGVGALVVAYIPFLVLLKAKGHKKTLLLLVLAGVVYVGGAVGCEKLSPDDAASLNTLSYNLGWISVEEGLEMAGVIIFIYTLLDYLRGGSTNTLRLEVASRPVAPEPAPDDGSRKREPTAAAEGTDVARREGRPRSAPRLAERAR